MILNDMRDLSSSFFSISYSYCFRDSNWLANHLARLASSSSAFCVWMEKVPIIIAPFVEADVPNYVPVSS